MQGHPQFFVHDSEKNRVLSQAQTVFDGFEEKYGVEPYKFADTTYALGGYVQGLSGFDWDKTYVCFDPTQVGDDRWNKMIEALKEMDISIEEGHWSELG